MENSVSSTFNTSSEAMVFTVIVVVTHLAIALAFALRFFDFDFSNCFLLLTAGAVSHWTTALVFDIVVWLNSTAVFALGEVDLGLDGGLFSSKSLLGLVIKCTLGSFAGLVSDYSRLGLIVVGSRRSFVGLVSDYSRLGLVVVGS